MEQRDPIAVPGGARKVCKLQTMGRLRWQPRRQYYDEMGRAAYHKPLNIKSTVGAKTSYCPKPAHPSDFGRSVCRHIGFAKAVAILFKNECGPPDLRMFLCLYGTGV